ncbi:hypothetical protein [Streptomyces physcomitrii]|uniref:Uncharacterized protein n=1 Tax=Streptomyces physcomitrii TaxID=2724184 RepID=A0ABX1H4Y1_9ACTN|nr:hypothetical protein [Streptomyces physcomitrii]NKI43423.1 hypothetical protein [Streptomyces physcomitrii]
MDHPSPGSPADRVHPAVCAHTHLFPGGSCRLRELPDPEGFAAAPRPLGLALRFSDGVVVADAELLVAEDGDTVLTVPAYTTGAGTPISERLWPVRKLLPDGEEVEVRVGAPAQL